MRSRPGRRLRTALANASLRVRVMAIAAFLVTITSVVMGSLGTALLHGYLLNRADQQLRDFGSVAARNLAAGARRPPRLPRAGQPAQPFQFLIEVVTSDGERLKIRDAKVPGRIREVSMTMLNVMQPTESEGKRLFRLARRGA